MLHFKNFFTLFLIFISLGVSTSSFAFNIPEKHSFSGVKYFSEESITSESEMNSHSSNIRTAILTQYSNWKGTRYYFGGTTHRGVDCSALMQHIFQDSFHKILPRTASQQIKDGQRVSKRKLKPGDLVFFKTSSHRRHVGVYVGNNEFIHASSKAGVIMSSLTNRYWVEHYETARRLKVTG